MNRYLTTYAQNREDLILLGFFDKDEKGFYVDVGANEPTHESVTKNFYDSGWHGINIEPIPPLHKKLVKERPRDINLDIAIGAKRGKAKLYYYPKGDGLSTMSENMAKSYRENQSVLTEFTEEEEEIEIEVFTLREILAKHANDKKISFMKVDVEGLEYEVLVGNDWSKYRPEVICIEANHVFKDWRKLLVDHDYVLVFFDGLNEYYTSKESKRAQKFDYVRSIIFKPPIINKQVSDDIGRYAKHIAWLEETIENLKSENEKTNAYVHDLQKQINEIRTLPRHVKTHLKRSVSRLDGKIIRKLSRKSNFKPLPAKLQHRKNELQKNLKKAQDYDKENFQIYAVANKHHILLPPYLAARRTAYSTAKSTKAKARRVRRR